MPERHGVRYGLPVSDDAAVLSGFLSGHSESHARVDRWILEALRTQAFSLGSDTEDVAQEVRRKLLISFRDERFRGESSLRTYVWKVAQRAAIDHARTRRRRIAPVPLEWEPVSDQEGPDAGLFLASRRTVFQKLMASLGEECRRLWELIFFEDLPYAEVARRLGITEGNVKVRALRCRNRAKEIYRGGVTSPPAGRPSP
jgi:RNA polymerase sigma-70 factor, ECF subfamily